MTEGRATVIGVFRGGCEAVCADEVLELRLLGRHAERELRLAVGDDISFDREREVVIECLPRRSELARRRPRARRGGRSTGDRRVLAANMDRVAIVSSVREPPFRAGVVDRFLVAAVAGGLEAVLIANKIDLLDGAPLPDEVRGYEAVVPVLPVSAQTGEGVGALRALAKASRTVLAGHSGVGKSSLINALEPELRLDTGELRTGGRRGRHTTTRATWVRLPGDAILVDTPGIRELETAQVDLEQLATAYPDVAQVAEDCRFRDCSHDREPDCAVRGAVEAGSLPAMRVRSYQKLRAEAGRQEGARG